MWNSTTVSSGYDIDEVKEIKGCFEFEING